MVKKHEYKGVQYDSSEEVEFVMWLEELGHAGYIVDWHYHPNKYELTPKQTYDETIILKTKMVTRTKTLLRPHTYEPDFIVSIRMSKCTELFEQIKLKEYSKATYFFDVKGTFDRNKSNTIFSINQKLMYDKYHIYVNKVVPAKLFKQTFVPKGCAYMKNRKVLTMRKPYKNCVFIEEFLEGLE